MQDDYGERVYFTVQDGYIMYHEMRGKMQQWCEIIVVIMFTRHLLLLVK